MTTFKHPLIVGDAPTGNPAANNQGFVTLTQRIEVSAGDAGNFIVVPPNSRLLPIGRFQVTTPITGSALAVLAVIGKSEGANEYGQIIVSASGSYTVAYREAISSVAGTIACKVQTITSASAEAITGFNGYIDLVYTVVS